MKRYLTMLVLVLTGCAMQDAEPAITTTTVPATTTTTTTTTTTVAPSTTTTIALPDHQWLCPEWTRLAVNVGWSPDELVALDTVMWRESRCNYDSHNPTDPMTGSYGLMQINGFWCDEWLQSQGILTECDDLFDPTVNLTAALAIHNRSGWNPWGGV